MMLRKRERRRVLAAIKPGQGVLPLAAARAREVAQDPDGEIMLVSVVFDSLMTGTFARGSPRRSSPSSSAHDVRLVVLGLSRQSRFEQVVLGSVTQAISVEAPCDVLLIPRPPQNGQRQERRGGPAA